MGGRLASAGTVAAAWGSGVVVVCMYAEIVLGAEKHINRDKRNICLTHTVVLHVHK